MINRTFTKRMVEVLMILSISTILSCARGTNKTQSSKTVVATNVTTVSPDTLQQTDYSQDAVRMLVTPPDIPISLVDPKSRGQYFIDHYWDSFDFDNVTVLNDTASFEQAIVDFLGIFSMAERYDLDKKKLVTPLERSEGDMLKGFMKYYRKYLYNPESFMMNSELYLQVAQWGVNSGKLSYADQVRTEYAVKLLSRNRAGHEAEPFKYMTLDSTYHELADLKDERVVLFFYSHGCESCHYALNEILGYPSIINDVKAGRTRLLFIIDSQDEQEWRESIAELPDFGTPAFNYDGRIINESLYDLRLSPSIFILDKGLKVHLSGVGFEDFINIYERDFVLNQ